MEIKVEELISVIHMRFSRSMNKTIFFFKKKELEELISIMHTQRQVHTRIHNGMLLCVWVSFINLFKWKLYSF